MSIHAMQHILDPTSGAVEAWLAERGLPKYRARQVQRALYAGRVTDFDEIHELPKSLRSELAADFRIWTTHVVAQRRADDGTEKLLLELADLYRSARDEAEGAVMLLEMVIRQGPPEHEPAALERLRVLFLEEERYDLYVEILRRQAERFDKDSTRARALAELGEALEWKVGDGVAAEREYRSALAFAAQVDLTLEAVPALEEGPA